MVPNMNSNEKTSSVNQRVEMLLATYTGPSLQLAKLLCDQYPEDSLAFRVIDEDFSVRKVTFGELKKESEILADALFQQGLRPGDRVATLMGKSQSYLVTILAIWRLGAVHVPLFTAFAPPSIELRLTSSSTKIVFCDQEHLEKLKAIRAEGKGDNWAIVSPVAESGRDYDFSDLMSQGREGMVPHVGDGDTTFIELYTSGTTGAPKGVALPIKALAGFHAYAEFGLDLRQSDIFWNAADPGWGYGLYFGILAVLTTGVAGTLYKGKFSAEATFKILRDHKVTNFTAAPTVYRSLRTFEGQTPTLSLRCASSAGEPLTPDINRWAPEALGVLVHDHYGQTESGMLVNNHHHPSLKAPVKRNSMGRPLPGWHVAVLDENTFSPLPPGHAGLLACDLSRSPFAWFKGYIGLAEKTKERFSPDGRWYLTGDVAQADADGAFYFSSRDDDVILMAGYRIGPFEVESVIATHPLIAECAVIAIPDELRGEVLEAVVVLTEGASPSQELTDEIKQKVKKEYAAHAYPRRVHYRSTLPKTPSGKTQRFLIRQEIAREAAKETT